MNAYRQRRITVMGLGAFGGGEGVVRFLCDRGARVTVTDLKPESELGETLTRLSDCRIEALHLGGHREDDFRTADLVVVNPGVPRSCPFLDVAREARVPLSSEMNLFIEHNRGRVLAVTGSIGKSTTTALVHAMLEAAGLRAWLGGNIGRSLLPQVDQIQPEDWVVLELSSFQLADLDRLQFRPEVGVVTNLRPNHLDWHPSLDDYRAAKQTILRWQRPDDIAVLNADDPDVASWTTRGRVLWFGQSLSASGRGQPADESAALEGVTAHDGQLRANTRRVRFNLDLRALFQVPGEHHALNAAAATAAAMAVGVDEPAIHKALTGFTALPHRLEFVGEFHGRRFYNDSKATTPEAAIAALNSFDAPVVLLAGGYDKHVDLSDFARHIAGRVKAVSLLGQTAPVLDQLIGLAATGAGVPPRISSAANFEEAVRWAVVQSAPGDVVLLSPGCASFGWFPNYVARGQAFADLVRTLEFRLQPDTVRHADGERGSQDKRDGERPVSAG